MNIPGILKIEFYPYALVTLPRITSNQTIDISNYTSETPVEIEFIPETASLKSPQKTHTAGDYFNVSVAFEIAGNDTTIPDLLRRGRYIYVLTDKSGYKWLVGLNNLPSFHFSLKSDMDGSGGRSMQCQIKWPTPVFPVYVS